jgi:hypothetical protein
VKRALKELLDGFLLTLLVFVFIALAIVGYHIITEASHNPCARSKAHTPKPSKTTGATTLCP